MNCAKCGKRVTAGAVYCGDCAPRWVSVKDRLPRHNEPVLLRTTYRYGGEDNPLTIGALVQPTDRRRKPYWSWIAWSVWGKLWAADICPGGEYVTHWMPLPEPPKEDKA